MKRILKETINGPRQEENQHIQKSTEDINKDFKEAKAAIKKQNEAVVSKDTPEN